MWKIKSVVATNTDGHSITVSDEKLTIDAKLKTNFHVRKTFPNKDVPDINAAINDFLDRVYKEALP